MGLIRQDTISSSILKLDICTFVANMTYSNKIPQAYILISSNEMQQYEGFYVLKNYSTSFGCLSHPSSGVPQTVTATSGTGHSVGALVVALTL
jgi:hypothetical protein